MSSTCELTREHKNTLKYLIKSRDSMLHGDIKCNVMRQISTDLQLPERTGQSSPEPGQSSPVSGATLASTVLSLKYNTSIFNFISD